MIKIPIQMNGEIAAENVPIAHAIRKNGNKKTIKIPKSPANTVKIVPTENKMALMTQPTTL